MLITVWERLSIWMDETSIWNTQYPLHAHSLNNCLNGNSSLLLISLYKDIISYKKGDMEMWLFWSSRRVCTVHITESLRNAPNNPWEALGYFSAFTKQLGIVHTLFVQYSDKIIFTGLTSCPQTHRTPREQNSYKAHVRWWEHWGYIVRSFLHTSFTGDAIKTAEPRRFKQSACHWRSRREFPQAYIPRNRESILTVNILNNHMEY